MKLIEFPAHAKHDLEQKLFNHQSPFSPGESKKVCN